MINNYNLSYYNLNDRMKEAFKCIGSFLAYKYSVDSRNFGNFDFNLIVEPSLELNLQRSDNKLMMTIQDKKNNFCTFISWEDDRRSLPENGTKTLLTLSNLCFSLLIDLENNENEENKSQH